MFYIFLSTISLVIANIILEILHCVTKNVCTQKEMSYNHETSYGYGIWGDKQMIKNSEQEIILLWHEKG